MVFYYKKNIGDYHKKAGRLTMLQHGAYTLLIDSCYDRERFPTEEEAIDWCWASTEHEIEAVRFVLRKFFELDGELYIQKRIQEEIDKYHQNSETNRRIALEREAKRRENSTKRVRNVNEPPPNQEPRTKNQEPRTKDQNMVVLPAWINQTLWDEFLTIRKKLKAVNSERALKIIIGKLESEKKNGHNPDSMLEKAIESSWKTVYPPNGNNVNVQPSPRLPEL